MQQIYPPDMAYNMYNQYNQMYLEQKGRKKGARKIYSFTALTLICSEVLTYAFYFAFMIFLRSAGYVELKDDKGLIIVTAGYVLTGFLSVTFSLIVCSLVFGSAFHLNCIPLFNVSKMKFKDTILLMLTALGTANIVYVVNVFLQSSFASMGLESTSIISDIYTPAGTFGEIVTTVIVAPVFEEIFYRGIVMRNLCKVDKKVAVIASALMFGLAHGNIYQFLLGFTVGIIFALSDIRYNSLIPSILCHILINSHTYIYNIDIYNGDMGNFFYFITEAVFIIIGCAAALKLMKSDKDFLSIDILSKNTKYGFKVMFTSVPIWIYFIASLWNMVSYFS